MKARELAALLMKNPDMEIMVLDSFNGGGHPREINLGPTPHIVTEENAEEAADCEDFVGETVMLIGYGSY